MKKFNNITKRNVVTNIYRIEYEGKCSGFNCTVNITTG
jgi:hypothetical protein